MNYPMPYYQTHGTGTPILLLHGYCEDLRMWDETVDFFKENYKIITIDLYGFGKSPKVGEASIEAYVKGVQLVLEELNIAQCILMGHSMGGYVALEFASQFPEKLLALGLIHSHPHPDTEAFKVARSKNPPFLEKYGSKVYAEGLIPKLFPKDGSLAIQKKKKALIENASQYDWKGIANGALAMRDRKDHSKTLEALKIPIWLLIGAKDPAIPKKNLTPQVAMPEQTYLSFHSDLGHMSMFTDPDWFLGEMKGFLSFL